MVRTQEGGKHPQQLEPVLIKLATLQGVEHISEDPQGAVSFIVNNAEYFLPVGGQVDAAEEIGRLEAELDYTRGFLKSVQKKLGNERFVQHAPPPVVEKERQKLADAESKIRVLTAQIEKLKS